MDKRIHIEGMTCAHCSNSIERALHTIPGVIASVDLHAKTARVTSEEDVSDDILITEITKLGFEVARIE